MTNTIKVAVIGCGYWGRNLVRNFSELGALVAIVDPNYDTAKTLGEEYDVPVLDEKAVLENPDIDAIATASPAPQHRDITIRALDFGKHVFVEKPIALTMEDGEAMRDRAQKVKRTLMVGHVLQYHPAYRKLCDMVRKGAIGQMRYIYSNRLSMGKYRHEEDVAWSFAPHDLSMILGLTKSTPKHVFTKGAMLVSPDKFDSAHLHLEFEDGLKAHVFTSWLSPFKEHKFVAVGEAGSLVFDDTADWPEKLVLTPHSMIDGAALKKGTVENVALEIAEPLKEECRHFLTSVESNSTPLSDADEALRVLSTLMRVEKSGKTGTPA